ncbi:MAG TPA: carbohydrate ABC transporter permease [Nitrospiraceae bacterium]|jgi:multiple sugar transport system permease protein|nr:carbohydrate ABC transporter permease [Nitrospiraceae bacterium]
MRTKIEWRASLSAGVGPAVRGVSLTLVVLVCLGPVLWQLLTSVKPDADLLRLPPILPEHPTSAHYRSVLDHSPLVRNLLNSAVVAASATGLAVGLGALCAFAVARLPIKGKSAVLGLALSISMFPPIAAISPLYLLVRELELRDTLAALILTHTTFALPLAVWILTGVFRQVPRELYWAARVDGCGPVRALVSVILPPALPGVAVAALLAFIYSWNEFMFALTFSATEASRTAPVAIALFPGLHETPWGEMAAASIIVTVPIVLLALVFQRQVVTGLTAGGVKG